MSGCVCAFALAINAEILCPIYQFSNVSPTRFMQSTWVVVRPLWVRSLHLLCFAESALDGELLTMLSFQGIYWHTLASSLPGEESLTVCFSLTGMCFSFHSLRLLRVRAGHNISPLRCWSPCWRVGPKVSSPRPLLWLRGGSPQGTRGHGLGTAGRGGCRGGAERFMSYVLGGKKDERWTSKAANMSLALKQILSVFCFQRFGLVIFW